MMLSTKLTGEITRPLILRGPNTKYKKVKYELFLLTYCENNEVKVQKQVFTKIKINGIVHLVWL